MYLIYKLIAQLILFVFVVLGSDCSDVDCGLLDNAVCDVDTCTCARGFSEIRDVCLSMKAMILTVEKFFILVFSIIRKLINVEDITIYRGFSVMY